MRFAGHETFYLREGWLHKGLKLLVEEPDKLVDEYSADWLGVGKNMAKSIRYWLQASGLAIAIKNSDKKTSILQPTELAQIIYKHDPFFLEIGTLYLLHSNIVNSDEHAFTWKWFFNYFNLPNFERAGCIDALMRYCENTTGRVPGIKTLQRDVSCLLNMYSIALPQEKLDPEDALDCPFIELAMMKHYKSSGRYQLNYNKKPIPFQVFAYNLAKTFPDIGNLPLKQIHNAPGSPGRTFLLSNESLYELVNQYSAREDVNIINSATDKEVKIQVKSDIEWVKAYYQQLDVEEKNVA